ncbi:M28 family peptidase [Solitalea koreensis]|uniref:Zn-dependent amino-or carboxypeptidase, M28 family n=1 Tax=Solitalea koreensis TaxID=543615 RepID=A0A521DKJ9_9SPHI|nr:M28 family peptidase [Solitalea koreensis]SMO72254.1 Zn-dependent amino-or carboxypeptidase, M28 family [Solitalea koreensis]
MNKKSVFFLVGVSISFLSHFAIAQTEITSNELIKHLEFLASDNMQGRFPGTTQCKEAGKYIAAQFKRSGIKPLSSSYFQPFDINLKFKVGKNNCLSVGPSSLSFEKDYLPLAFSANGTVEGNVVFVGYGFKTDADTLRINDYAGLDLKGKWVLVLKGLPDALAAKQLLKEQSIDYTKAKQAEHMGAAGVLFVSGLKSNEKDELTHMRPRKDKSLGIPVIHIKRTVANQLLSSTGKTIEQLEKEYASTDNKSLNLNKPLTASVDLELESVKTNNIVGVIEGIDPVLKAEYIVLGAHYDHLGHGGYQTGSKKPDTSAIHNGADDNASGTAALLSIGRKLAVNRQLLKRSVILIAIGAEEEGLLGSDYFVNHPPVPLNTIKGMVNMDMVGRLDSSRNVYVGGAGTFPDGVALLKSIAAQTDLHANVFEGGVGGSDHVSFYNKNIPVLGIHTGGHPQYHTPEDDIQLINKKGIQAVADFICKAMIALVNLDQPIVFNKPKD